MGKVLDFFFFKLAENHFYLGDLFSYHLRYAYWSLLNMDLAYTELTKQGLILWEKNKILQYN